MTLLEFLIYGLATFRLSYLVTNESGPMFLFLKLRKAAKKDKGSSLAEGISCPYCVSVWCAILVTLFVFFRRELAHWANLTGYFIIIMLAISGLAIVIHQLFTWLRRE